MFTSIILLSVTLLYNQLYTQAFVPSLNVRTSNLISKVSIKKNNHEIACLYNQNIRNVNKNALFMNSESKLTTSDLKSSDNDENKSSKLKVGGLFALWYALNVGYNIYNKKVLNLAPGLTWWAAWFQMAVGNLIFLPLWISGVRKAPKLNNKEIKNLIPVSILHSLVHIGGVVSMGAGAVSFAHVIKASEPAISALLSAIFLKSFLPLPVYLTLLPVMGGVALASLGELSFSWKAFNYAMLSNIASASRGIVGKATMGQSIGKNMNATNLYSVLTIIATVLLLPIALILEGNAFIPTLKALFEAGTGQTYVIQTIVTGMFYYLYNEVAFLCLDNVAPVTHALGNTIKRVVIIIASVLAFGTKMTAQGIIGSSTAIFGVLLYSIAKSKFS